jgi:nucleotide-binding universal stress UspA family protein
VVEAKKRLYTGLSESSGVFQKIVVAYDGSQKADRALNVGIELAKALGSELKIVTVVEPLSVYFKFAMTKEWVGDWKHEKEAQYTALQKHARRQAAAAGLHVDTEMIHGDKVGSIIECTLKHHADLLIFGMGKHTSSIGRTGWDVAERSPCALLGVT